MASEGAACLHKHYRSDAPIETLVELPEADRKGRQTQPSTDFSGVNLAFPMLLCICAMKHSSKAPKLKWLRGAKGERIGLLLPSK